MPATATKKKTKINIQPLGDRIVVARDDSEDVTPGGIVDDGTRGEIQVKKGDRVLFTSYAPESITIDDEEFLLMSESDILAVIE